MWIFAVAIYCNRKQAVYGRAYEIHIFPLDRLPVSKDAEELLCELLQMIAQIVEREETDAEVSKQLLDKVEVLTGTKIDQNGNVKNQLLCLADALSQIYDECGRIYILRAGNPRSRTS